MSNDLISRKSVLDYIEKEIATAKSTETISYLRALSVHINEYEPTAFDVDKVVEQLEEEKMWYETHGVNMDMKKGIIGANCKAIKIVRRGGIDEKTS